MSYLDLARQRAHDPKLVPNGAQDSQSRCDKSDKSDISRVEPKDQATKAIDAAGAEYDSIGVEIDALYDLAQAARARGDVVGGERLGAECRAMVVGPYLRARERFAALLDGAEAAQREQRSLWP